MLDRASRRSIAASRWPRSRSRRARSLCAGLDEPAAYRSLLALQAAHDAEAGHPDRALDGIRTAIIIGATVQDPRGDCDVAVLHTYVLMLMAAAAEEVIAAAAPALEAGVRWGLDDFSTDLLRKNLSEVLRLAGRVHEAAELIDPVTQGAPSRDRWPAHSERALLDLLRGHREAAIERIEALSSTFFVDIVNLSLIHI